MTEFGKYDWTAVAAPEYGGNLLRLAWRGNELLRTTEDSYLLSATPEQYGIPVLFPPGRIDGGQFEFEGKKYYLPLNEPTRGNHLHGIALRRCWALKKHTADCVKMCLQSDTRAPEFSGFPFLFELTLIYRCLPDRLEQVLTVANLGGQAMPCAVGFHTMFQNVRMFRLETTGMCWETLPPRYLATGRQLPDSAFDPQEEHMPELQSISGQLQAPRKIHSAWLTFDWGTLEYQVDEKFGNWCLWNGNPPAGFLAVEPLCGISGGLNLPTFWDKIGLLKLDCGKKLTFTSNFIATQKAASSGRGHRQEGFAL